MKLKPVTDPTVLQQLKPVQDPEILRQLQASPAPVPEKPASPTEGMSGFETTMAGIGGGLTSLGRGAQQALLSPFEGKGVENRRAELTAQEQEARQLDKPLMETTGGKVGRVIGKALPAVAASVIPGANTLAGSMVVGGLLGTSEPTVEGESRLANAGLGAAGGAAGYGAGKVLEKGAQAVSNAIGSPARQAAAQSMNRLKDQAAAQARSAGFTIPPSQTNPTLTNRLLEGTAGKITTSQHASKANEAVVQRLVAKELGIKDVTPASVAAVRDNAGKVYETLKAQPPFVADNAFLAEMAKVGQVGKTLAADFPDLATKNVDDVVNNIVSRPQFSAEATVEAVKRLRSDAKLAWRAAESSGKPEQAALGDAKRQIADALENLIERNLSGTNPGLLPQFKQARTLIAKAHSVEAAMNEGSGFVSALALGNMKQAGVPLSGNLDLIANTALNYPRAVQFLKGQSVLPVSPLDMTNLSLTGGLGGVATAATGNPLFMLGMVPAVARPGIRAAILSRPYQLMSGAPSYTPALTSAGKIARALAPAVGAALPQTLQQEAFKR